MLPRPLQIGNDALLHIQDAKGHYERYERLLQNSIDVDWALVSLFYSALHLVQAHAIAKCPTRLWSSPPKLHRERLRYVNDHLGSLNRVYSRLQTAGEEVRYELWKPTIDEVLEYHDKEFATISEYLYKLGISWF